MSDQVGNQNVGFLVTRLKCICLQILVFATTNTDASSQQSVYLSSMCVTTSDTVLSVMMNDYATLGYLIFSNYNNTPMQYTSMFKVVKMIISDSFLIFLKG